MCFKKNYLTSALLFLCLSLNYSCDASGEEEPHKPLIVTTIKPLSIIAAAAVQGKAKVEYLQSGAQTTHDLYLSPSSIRILSLADLVVRVSPDFESNLNKYFESRDQSNLITAANLNMNWPMTSHAAKSFHTNTHDLHFWLDPDNASVLATEINQRLNLDAVEIMSEGEKSIYRKRLMKYRERLSLAQHDAYSHFTNAFELRPFITIRDSAGQTKGVASHYKIREKVKLDSPACILIEPNYHKKEATILSAELDVPIRMIDPEGRSVELGPNAYTDFFKTFIMQYESCFS
jgi:zinc transport system substrate-binding protein